MLLEIDAVAESAPHGATLSREKLMLSNSHEFVRPRDDGERTYLESLVREDYDRCHLGETFDDMKQRMAFSKEDRGLYRDWLAVAAARAAVLAAECPFLIAAE